MNTKITFLLFSIFLTSLGMAEKFRVIDGDGWRDLYHGERPIWRHMTAFDASDRETTYKTYHHVYGFDGKGFITKGPGGKYTHHRGIYLGWSKTKTHKGQIDFWHVKGTKQQSVRHITYHDDKQVLEADKAVIASETHWIVDDGTAVVKDMRTVTSRLLDNGAVQLDFDIVIESVEGEIELHGDPQHAGFQFRPVNEVTATKATYIRDVKASGGKGDVWKTCHWVINNFEVNGKGYHVLHMNHPDNPGDTVYSTRNYGRFGAYAPHKIAAGDKLNLKYRLVISDKPMDQAAGQAAFDGFVKK